VATVTVAACEPTGCVASCPTADSYDVAYNFKNNLPVDIKVVTTTDYLPTGTSAANIESITFANGSIVSSPVLTPSGAIQAGIAKLNADNSITFTPSTSQYCTTSLVKFYVKMAGCTKPLEITLNFNAL
jgi:hypothetical protein